MDLRYLRSDNTENKQKQIYSFVITDLNNDIYVEYKGLLPNLFQEEKDKRVLFQVFQPRFPFFAKLS